MKPNEIHVDGLKKTFHIPYDVLDTLNFMGVRYRVPERDQRYIIIQKKVLIGYTDENRTKKVYQIREYRYWLKSGKATWAESNPHFHHAHTFSWEGSSLEEFLEKHIK